MTEVSRLRVGGPGDTVAHKGSRKALPNHTSAVISHTPCMVPFPRDAPSMMTERELSVSSHWFSFASATRLFHC